MASLTYFSLAFFLLLLTLSLLPIHARVMTSFSKALHTEFPSETETKPQEIPTSPVGGEEPENLPPQSQNGYGLYGRGREEYFPTNERSRLPRTEFSTEIPDSREANAFYQYDEIPKNKNEYGMSDTRVVENGKYFFDLNHQRRGDAYDPARGGSEGYGVYNYKGRGKGYGAYSQEMEGKQNYENQEINQEEYYDP